MRAVADRERARNCRHARGFSEKESSIFHDGRADVAVRRRAAKGERAAARFRDRAEQRVRRKAARRER